MKRFLSIFLAIFALTLAACTSSEEENGNNSQGGGDKPSSQPEVTITTPPAPTVSEKGGNDIIAFHAEKPWSAKVLNTRAEGWCSIYPTSGQAGDVEITITTAPNDSDDDRSATIIIQAGSTQIIITITQKQQDALTVTASKFEVAAEGGEVEIEVKANVDYDYTIDPDAADWVKYKATRALESSTLVFEVAENEDMEKREAQIMIHSGDLEELVTIYQEGNEPTIILSKNEYTVSDKGETIAVEVKSNVDVAVEIPSDVDWVKENSTRAMSTNTFYLDVAPNEDYNSRSTSIKFTNKENNLSETVTITQAQKDAIVIAKDSYTINYAGGEIDIKVGHNVDFDVEISDNWIIKATTRVFETETLTFNIAANNSYDSREGTIKFISKDKSISQTVKVFQSQSNALIVSKKDIVIDEKEQTVEFEVRANVEYTVSSPSASWLHREDTRAMTSQTIRYRVDANNSNDSREGTIKLISKDKTITQTVKVVQAAATPKPKNNEIWYTSTDGNIVTPYKTDVFGANIVYNIYENGKGVITFDKSVTTIGERAFYGCRSLKSVTIPDSVTEIGAGAFQVCSSLRSITIPDSVTSIGEWAFSSCSSLTSVTIPDSVTTIEQEAFSGCSRLTSFTIGNSVTTIGEYAFYKCYSLKAFYGKFASADNKALIVNGTLNAFAIGCGATSYAIPDNVTTIGYEAFACCSSLTTITIPNSVTTIEQEAFSGCSRLKSVTIPDSVTTIGRSAFSGCSSLTSVTIGNSVTEIGYEAFSSCSSLTSVTIGNSVTSIGEAAFYLCSSLTNVNIPDSVTTIGEDAFNGCSSLTNITIPDSVTSIGGGAFYHCRSLTTITIPDSVTKIGGSAFSGCSSLTSVTIPDSVTAIGNYAFAGCSSLTSITIPDSVTSIGYYAFSYCSSLTTITIPDSVTEIGAYAFQYCSSLKSVYCRPQIPPTAEWDDDFLPWMAFINNASGRKIYVPKNSVAAYKAAYGWDYYADAIVGYDF